MATASHHCSSLTALEAPCASHPIQNLHHSLGIYLELEFRITYHRAVLLFFMHAMLFWHRPHRCIICHSVLWEENMGTWTSFLGLLSAA